LSATGGIKAIRNCKGVGIFVGCILGAKPVPEGYFVSFTEWLGV
jgi:hypothetical protein